MVFEEMFDHRVYLGEKLKDYLRNKGYTKSSFCKKSEISRPTLDRLLNGEVENKRSFDKHFRKILACLDTNIDTILKTDTDSSDVEAVYSQNAPENYQMNETAAKEYDLLMDVLNLCSIYY